MNKLISHPSPNWNERPTGTVIDTVIIHYTGMKSGQDALERLCDEDAQVSAHYLIEEDGNLFQLVKEDKRAWHAGISYWRGMNNLNHNSIGIELVNPGHEFGYRGFPEKQIAMLLKLLKDIHQRHDIVPANVIGHSDIAPDRKSDPGELFPWGYLSANGFGLFSQETGESTTQLLKRDDNGKAVEKMNSLLKIVGYNITEIKTFTQESEDALRAFQMHWRQRAVTGGYDRGTAIILQDIAGKIARDEDIK
nr:N-acetylmuramoyl-L-alanine amidase [Kordiimonas laminariae]